MGFSRKNNIRGAKPGFWGVEKLFNEIVDLNKKFKLALMALNHRSTRIINLEYQVALEDIRKYIAEQQVLFSQYKK